MTIAIKSLLAAGLVAGVLPASAEAKIYRSTYNSESQDRTVTLANTNPLPLALSPNILSTAFTLPAKTRVAFTVSANCAIGTPGVVVTPSTDVRFFVRIHIDGQPFPSSTGHALCTGDGTPATDNLDSASVTLSKVLDAGTHTIQLIPNPQPVLGTGTTYHIDGLALVIHD